MRGISGETVRLLGRAADLADPAALQRLRGSPRAVYQSLELLRRFLRHLFGSDIQGWDLVQPGSPVCPVQNPGERYRRVQPTSVRTGQNISGVCQDSVSVSQG
jgi:hypothetical protein